MNIYQNGQAAEAEETYLTHDQYLEYKASCEQVIEQADAAMRLAQNPDFIKIMMEAYFEGEPRRLAGLMTSGRLNEKMFDECVSELRAIGSSRSFLNGFIEKGKIARDELQNVENAWNEAVEEQARSVN